MLKKLIKSLLLIVLFSYINVYAASSCSYSEQAALNSEVANIKASYEVVKELIDPSTYTCYNPNGCEEYKEYFKITILNLSENFYIEVSNSLNDATITVESSEDGEPAFFYWSKINEVTTFTFKVYSSVTSGCYGENYRTFRLTTPRKNRFAPMNICVEHKDSDYCKEYVTFKDMTLDEFLKLFNSNNDDPTNPDVPEEKISVFTLIVEFIIAYKLAFIIGGAALVVIIIIIIAIKRQRRVL